MVRIIPACAGSSPSWAPWRQGGWDHPRVCGEQALYHIPIDTRGGSSPRVRGAEGSACRSRIGRRIIPACAGSSSGGRRPRTPPWDHPRVCGEQPTVLPAHDMVAGSSPRVRGAGHEVGEAASLAGIIPACAGSRSCPRASACFGWDHPRVCGEQRLADAYQKVGKGSSPRVRGAASARPSVIASHGIIPACAGSSPTRSPRRQPPGDHPRVCGEQPLPLRLPPA